MKQTFHWTTPILKTIRRKTKQNHPAKKAVNIHTFMHSDHWLAGVMQCFYVNLELERGHAPANVRAEALIETLFSI